MYFACFISWIKICDAICRLLDFMIDLDHSRLVLVSSFLENVLCCFRVCLLSCFWLRALAFIILLCDIFIIMQLVRWGQRFQITVSSNKQTQQLAWQPYLQRGDGPIVLVVAPTRELALQIKTECDKFGASSEIKNTCVYGGVPKHTQVRDLR